MGTFPLLVSLDTRSTIDIDLPSCMSPSSDVFAVFLRILRCPVWHSRSRCHSVTVSRYAMPYHVMSWGLESLYCLSKRLQVFGLTQETSRLANISCDAQGSSHAPHSGLAHSFTLRSLQLSARPLYDCSAEFSFLCELYHCCPTQPSPVGYDPKWYVLACSNVRWCYFVTVELYCNCPKQLHLCIE